MSKYPLGSPENPYPNYKPDSFEVFLKNVKARKARALKSQIFWIKAMCQAPHSHLPEPRGAITRVAAWIGVTEMTIRNWRTRRLMPPEMALRIEHVTRGAYPADLFRPDILDPHFDTRREAEEIWNVDLTENKTNHPEQYECVIGVKQSEKNT